MIINQVSSESSVNFFNKIDKNLYTDRLKAKWHFNRYTFCHKRHLINFCCNTIPGCLLFLSFGGFYVSGSSETLVDVSKHKYNDDQVGICRSFLYQRLISIKRCLWPILVTCSGPKSARQFGPQGPFFTHESTHNMLVNQDSWSHVKDFWGKWTKTSKIPNFHLFL